MGVGRIPEAPLIEEANMVPVQKKLVETYERHSEMLQCMADTIGVDLGKAMLRHDM